MGAGVQILDALPHRAPFRFVTSILQVDPGRCGWGVWKLTGAEDFFAGHFPGRPVVPGVLLGEALAQMAGLVGLHEGAGDRAVDGRLAQIDLRFEHAVCPPAEIQLHVSLVRRLGRLSLYEVRAEADGQIAARGTLTLAEVDGGAGAAP
jgi:3-hydroxyacyl-[acyl-carrier-protein] dehydratase